MGVLGVMAVAWIVVAIWITIVIYSNKKAQPSALFYLFFVELWERFSYYGMRALLMLYMTKGFLEYTQDTAYGVYAAYGAMVYLTPIIGGILAEQVMGYRKAIMWGAILMAAGHFAMAFEQEDIFLSALALLILGNGFFKPNISSLIGKFYDEGDPRRDQAFTIFYMGINVGAFLTPLTCGAIGETYGWHYGFGIAGIGMVVGLVIFWIAQRRGVFGEHGLPPTEQETAEESLIEGMPLDAPVRSRKAMTTRKIAGLSYSQLTYIGSILAIPLVWLLIRQNQIMDILLGVIGTGMIVAMIVISMRYEKVQRERIWAVMVFFLAATVFWSFFELAGSALTIFTDQNVDKNILGVLELKTSVFQSINPLFIIIFAPVFSWMWSQLNKRNAEPIAPVKFGIGMALLGLGFLVLNLGKGAAINGIMPGIFIIFLYLLHTLGELAISPVGLSLVTKLSPGRIVSIVMGFWLLASSIAHQAGKYIAKYTVVPKDATPEESLAQCLDVFTNLGFIAIGVGVFMLLMTPIVKRWMHGIR